MIWKLDLGLVLDGYVLWQVASQVEEIFMARPGKFGSPQWIQSFAARLRRTWRGSFQSQWWLCVFSLGWFGMCNMYIKLMYITLLMTHYIYIYSVFTFWV